MAFARALQRGPVRYGTHRQHWPGGSSSKARRLLCFSCSWAPPRCCCGRAWRGASDGAAFMAAFSNDGRCHWRMRERAGAACSGRAQHAAGGDSPPAGTTAVQHRSAGLCCRSARRILGGRARVYRRHLLREKQHVLDALCSGAAQSFFRTWASELNCNLMRRGHPSIPQHNILSRLS